MLLKQQEAAERQVRLEEEQRSFTEALTTTERKLAEEKGEILLSMNLQHYEKSYDNLSYMNNKGAE